MTAVAHHKQNWWLYLVEGVVLIIFGIIAALVPAQTFLWLGIDFGILLVTLGVISMISGTRGAGKTDWWWLELIVGLLEIGLGFYLLRHPVTSIATFATVAAIALIVRSVLAVFEAFDNNLSGLKRALIGVVGILGLLAGIAIWNHPVRGTIVFVWILGIYALVAGPMRIVSALEAREAK